MEDRQQKQWEAAMMALEDAVTELKTWTRPYRWSDEVWYAEYVKVRRALEWLPTIREEGKKNV